MQTITLRFPGGPEDRPVLFDLNIIGAVQKRYGDLKTMNEKTADTTELLWIITALINEAAKYEAFTLGKQVKLLTEEQVGMLLLPSDLVDGTIKNAIMSALNESVGDTEKKT